MGPTPACLNRIHRRTRAAVAGRLLVRRALSLKDARIAGTLRLLPVAQATGCVKSAAIYAPLTGSCRALDAPLLRLAPPRRCNRSGLSGTSVRLDEVSFSLRGA